MVYLEDFWHPGAESLFYVRSLTGKKFKIGCFCHAQSVDDTDFTWKMRDWMRPIEQGFGRQYDFVFTCSPILRNLLLEAGIGTEDSVFLSGLPFNSGRLTEQLRDMGVDVECRKEDFCLFSSRFDPEKDPMFFLDVVDACPELKFKLVSPYTSRPISKDPEVMDRLSRLVRRGNLEIVSTVNKAVYYQTLFKAKVQFNCALQDWVSWTLVEAAFAGCLPLYPTWKDFPSELHGDQRFLYKRRDLQDACRKLRTLMKSDPVSVKFIVDKHDGSWSQYLKTMGVIQA